MVEEMEEKIKDCTVQVVGNYKVASFLINKGYRVVNIKKYRNFICEITNTPCDKRSVFVFDATDENFLEDYEYAKKFYDEI